MLVLSPVLAQRAPGVLLWWCPGCEEFHQVHTQEPNRCGAKWSWDGNAEAPTFSPSIHIHAYTPAEGDDPEFRFCCHTFVRNGVIQFLDDCTHKLAGQTVPLPPLPTHGDQDA